MSGYLLGASAGNHWPRCWPGIAQIPIVVMPSQHAMKDLVADAGTDLDVSVA